MYVKRTEQSRAEQTQPAEWYADGPAVEGNLERLKKEQMRAKL
jgi:hypothetical protein